MADEDDSGTDSEEEGSIAEPVQQGMRTISLLEFVVFGLLWVLIVLCAAFFYALLRHAASSATDAWLSCTMRAKKTKKNDDGSGTSLWFYGALFDLSWSCRGVLGCVY
jgi:hypothetical protein